MADSFKILDRRDQAMKKLLKGHTTSEISLMIREQYGVSRATAERDISYCYDQIRKKYERSQNIPQLVAEHIAKYEQIRVLALEAYDFKAAISALQSIEKLLKLHKDEPLIALQQNNTNINLENLSMEELLKLMENG